MLISKGDTIRFTTQGVEFKGGAARKNLQGVVIGSRDGCLLTIVKGVQKSLWVVPMFSVVEVSTPQKAA